MTSRRNCLAALAGFAATVAVIHAGLASQVLKAEPKPKLIKGENGAPDKVDFGHGLLVPMSKDAFHTLWEGDDRWITYGHGFGPRAISAMAGAEEAAIGTMTLYLLTLAFAPDRLMRVDGGGWRLKSGNVVDLVKGEIRLPGRPVMPTTDHVSGGQMGDADTFASDEEATHATTGYLVWKRDATLDYVRQNAILAQN
jgi:hypothetical protein